MTTPPPGEAGWEQRLENLARAQERAAGLREGISDELSGWPIGSGYYATTVGADAAREMADTLMAGPLAPLLEAQAALDGGTT